MSRSEVSCGFPAVEVRCLRIGELLPDDAACESARATLPEWRRRKADSFRFAADRRRSVAVWLLLRQLLSERGVDVDRLAVKENEFGKPGFDPRVGLHFSLSHAGERVMAAVSESPVGCDVERIAPLNEEVAEACMTDEELASVLASAEDRDRAFCRLWVRKESWVKAQGRGMSFDFRSFCVLPDKAPGVFRDFEFDDGYCGCVCQPAVRSRAKNPGVMTRVLGMTALAFAVVLSVVGCSGREAGGDAPTVPAVIRTAADLKGRRVAHMSSDFHRRELRALQPDVVFEPYSEYAFAVESLRNGKIDGISLGRTYADIWMAKFPGEFLVAFEYADDVCCFLLPKHSPFKPKLDAELRRMNASGETAAIIGRWSDGAKSGRPPAMPTFPPSPEGAPEIRVACAAQAEPWCFVADGGLAGADVEILRTAAHRLGMRLKPKIFSWGGMVDCVNAGRCEIANGGIYTAGLSFPTVDASEKYADERMCILVRDPSFRKAAGIVAFARSLRASFRRTFVEEDRWRMLADGFGVTLLITFLSALLGTALAFPVWLARTSRKTFVASVAKAYIAVLQGTPVLVLLMVLFYIVFGSVDIDGMWVAVVGFGLNLSAYVGEMLRSGVDSVPRGQTEAALALGYAPRRAFYRFVLPQAVRAVLPVYRGELIGLLKMTSIVGYIAIGDLTKASDLVRSRTYESFFPIITTAFVYFAASWLLALLIERLGRRLDPGCGRRKARGK